MLVQGRPVEEWRDTLTLCDRYRQDGVVGIDTAGDEGAYVAPDTSGEKHNFLNIVPFKAVILG